VDDLTPFSFGSPQTEETVKTCATLFPRIVGSLRFGGIGTNTVFSVEVGTSQIKATARTA
jgi:hypothetical protein